MTTWYPPSVLGIKDSFNLNQLISLDAMTQHWTKLILDVELIPQKKTKKQKQKQQTANSKQRQIRLQYSIPHLTAYPAMYGPMAHHYGNEVTALTPGSTEGSAHGKL